MDELEELFLIISADPFLEDEDRDGLLLLLLEQQITESERVGFRLDLDTLTNRECRERFRFAKDDLRVLCEALEIPDPMIAPNRLVYPNRRQDLVGEFGRGKAEISIIFNCTLQFITNRWDHLLSGINPEWLTEERLEEGCAKIGQRCPLQNLWGFIDGTPRAICRPIVGQRLMYSGHKRVHCIKFQAIMTPFGIVAHLFGPVEGRRHDAGMLQMSGLLPQLEQHRDRAVNGIPNGVYSLYGDPAYPMRPHLLAPYRDAHLTANQLEFNKQMSSVRESVEWGFGKVATLFAFVDFKKNLKLFLQPVARYYKAATLLTNCHTCLYGSQVSKFFDVDPPSLQEYLQ